MVQYSTVVAFILLNPLYSLCQTHKFKAHDCLFFCDVKVRRAASSTRYVARALPFFIWIFALLSSSSFDYGSNGGILWANMSPIPASKGILECPGPLLSNAQSGAGSAVILAVYEATSRAASTSVVDLETTLEVNKMNRF